MFSKLKNQLPPASLLAAGLITITLLTALSGLWNYNNGLAGQSAITLTGTSARRAAAGAFSKNTGLMGTNGAAGSNTGNSSAKISPAGTGGSHATASKSGTSGNTSTPATTGSATQPAAISVALSVNGSGKGQVQLAAGGNQCDVLTQALAEGVISSLNMRYNSQYGSEAVYVIDGIGDPGTVNWTYAVNGTLPPYGCTYVTAHNGDSVNWQYR